MSGGIGERIDDLQLLDDRAGPSVRDDERQRILVFRTNVNEMDVEPIDLGDELRQRVQSRLALAPVVFGRPVARELLNGRELHALRCIRDRLPLGPPGCVDSPAQVGKFRFRNIHAKRTQRILVGGVMTTFCSNGFGHDVSSGVVVWWAEEPYCARDSIPAIGEARRNHTRRTIPRLLDDGVARYFGVSRGSQRRGPAPTPSSNRLMATLAV